MSETSCNSIVALDTLPADFRRYVVQVKTGCWYWKGGRGKWRLANGRRVDFPVYYNDTLPIAAFQFAWEHLNGPMPKTHGLYRACHGVCCVNPAHRLLLPKGLGISATRSRVTKLRKRNEIRDHWRATTGKLP